MPTDVHYSELRKLYIEKTVAHCNALATIEPDYLTDGMELVRLASLRLETVSCYNELMYYLLCTRKELSNKI